MGRQKQLQARLHDKAIHLNVKPADPYPFSAVT